MTIVDDDFATEVVVSSEAIDDWTAKWIDGAHLSALDGEISQDNLGSYDAEYPVHIEVKYLVVGDRLEIFGSLDNQFYSGTVQSIYDNKHCISYLEGDQDVRTLTNQTWCTLPVVTGSDKC